MSAAGSAVAVGASRWSAANAVIEAESAKDRTSSREDRNRPPTAASGLETEYMARPLVLAERTPPDLHRSATNGGRSLHNHHEYTPLDRDWMQAVNYRRSVVSPTSCHALHPGWVLRPPSPWPLAHGAETPSCLQPYPRRAKPARRLLIYMVPMRGVEPPTY